MAVVSEALAIIRQGTAEVRRSASALTISVLPSFALNWLMPRLPEFDVLHPEISVRLAGSYRVIDFAQDTDIDVDSSDRMESHRRQKHHRPHP